MTEQGRVIGQIACVALIVFTRLINAGVLFPIVFRKDGTTYDPLLDSWRRQNKTIR